ncbi:MAG TPA: ATP-binding protein [Gemmatimonadaceae bacterium]|nr:ATP-binding protein [Gemmatimonadaceae bacterium]
MTWPHTILVVDDDADVRNGFCAVLAADGYGIVGAENGTEAVELALHLRPDVILLDLVLPGLDGFAVCRRIRDDPVIGAVPIVVLSGLGDHASRIAALEAGADDFLEKPVEPAELRVRVRNLCKLNRFQRALHDRERYERLLTLAPDAVLVVDRDLRVHVANPAAVRLFSTGGRTIAEGAMLGDFVSPRGRDTFEAQLRRALANGAPVELVETTLPARGDAWPEVEGVAGVVDWDDEPALQLYLRDVSATRQLQREAAHRNRLEALGKLSAEVAHDFANVLMALSTHLALLGGEEGTDASTGEIVADAQHVIQRGAALVRDLLAYGRPRTPDATWVDVPLLVAQIDRMMRPLMPARVTLRVEAEPDVPQLATDRHQLHQAIVNLILNARDAIIADGTITVRVGQFVPPGGEPMVEVRVRDTGIGIPPELHERIFEPFFSTKREDAGTGLGLAIVADLVKTSGGTIAVESEPGRGSTFTLRLPLYMRRPSPAVGTPIPDIPS